jgi:hypothetical protein
MKIYPKGLLVLAAFAVILAIGIDTKLGLAAVLACVVIEVLLFLGPVMFGRTRGPS